MAAKPTQRETLLCSLIKSTLSVTQTSTSTPISQSKESSKIASYLVTSPHLLLIYASRCDTVATIAVLSHLLSRSNFATDHGIDNFPFEFVQILSSLLKLSLSANDEGYSPCAACVVPLLDCLTSLRVVRDDIVSAGLSKVIGKLQRRVRKIVNQEGGPPDTHEICGGAEPRKVHEALSKLTMKWGKLWEEKDKDTEPGAKPLPALDFDGLRARIKEGITKENEEAKEKAEQKKKKKRQNEDKAMKEVSPIES